MPRLDVAGKYKGRISTSCVNKTENGCTQFETNLNLTGFFFEENANREKGWDVVPDAPLQTKGWFVLTKRDGGINEHQVKALKESLGWDGKSLRELHETDWSEVDLIVVATEGDDGKVNIAWLNNPAGGMKTLSEDEFKELDGDWQKLTGPTPGFDEDEGPAA